MTALPLSNNSLYPYSYTHKSTVHFDELDPMHMLHNSRFAAQVERATIAFFGANGHRWEKSASTRSDQFHVVRDFQIEFLAPVGPGDIDVEIWVENLGRSSCVYGFRCTSRNGSILHAKGLRTIVKIDPEKLQPVPWTEEFREAHRPLMRPLASIS